MIPIDGSVRIFVATQPVDVRAGINRLMGLVTHVLGHDACAGDVFVFRNKGADKVKLVRHDGSGAVMATKWLDRGRFYWPPATVQIVTIAPIVSTVRRWIVSASRKGWVGRSTSAWKLGVSGTLARR